MQVKDIMTESPACYIPVPLGEEIVSGLANPLSKLVLKHVQTLLDSRKLW